MLKAQVVPQKHSNSSITRKQKIIKKVKNDLLKKTILKYGHISSNFSKSLDRIAIITGYELSPEDKFSIEIIFPEDKLKQDLITGNPLLPISEYTGEIYYSIAIDSVLNSSSTDYLFIKTGLGLEEYNMRIPCPHCESTDCCSIKYFHGKLDLCCSYTKKRITHNNLKTSAEKQFSNSLISMSSGKSK